MTNVSRHAGAARCEERLSAQDGAVVLTVWDDGLGVAEDTEPGLEVLSTRQP